jgi:hypothetical protein
MPHLARMVEDYGAKGLNVLAITDEPREAVLRYLSQASDAPSTFPIGVGGGTGNYPAPAFPMAFLISAEGKVVWQGNPGQFNEKLLAEEVKKVKITDEMRAAKAAKSVAFAEDLITKSEVLRARILLEKVQKDPSAGDAAKRAAEVIESIDKDPRLKKDLTAQRALEKLLGGIEMPREKVKEKNRESLAKELDDFARKTHQQSKPTGEMAATWARILREQWKAKQ